MINSGGQLGNVSDTALVIAYIRGQESQREDAKFKDPLAIKLCQNNTQQLVDLNNKKLLTRVLSKSLSNSVVVRTVLIDEIIDEAVNKKSIKRVVNLGSGLDTRPYRLNLPGDLEWIEVDLAEVIDYKKESLESEEPRCRISYIKKDISQKDQLESLFQDQLFTELKDTLVLTEGLLVYLDEEAVIELSQFLLKQDFVKQWVTDVYSPFSIRVMQRAWSRQLGKEVNFSFGTKDSYKFFSSLGWNPENMFPVFEHNERIGRTSSLNSIRKILSVIFGKKFKKIISRSSVILDLGKPNES